MSKESESWLNRFIKRGFTKLYGDAWWRNNEMGGGENHYEGAIPLSDIMRDLFHWKPVRATMVAEWDEPVDPADENSPRVDRRLVSEDRITTVRPPGTLGEEDPGAILGAFKDKYQIHDFEEWCIKNVSTLIDDNLQPSSAGLLRGGAVGWVQIQRPTTVSTPEGITIWPFIAAITSLDGSIATTYLSGSTNIQCDNTMSCALMQSDRLQVKIRHSAHSLGKIGEVRDALRIIAQVEEDFEAQVRELCRREVSVKEFDKWMNHRDIAPLVDPKGKDLEGRALSLARGKQEALRNLYMNDSRCAPWQGTAWGVLQTGNTWAHHFQTAKGKGRVERNFTRMVTGQVEAMDRMFLSALDVVLAV